VLRQSGNLLLLDEPTNDLDVATLRWGLCLVLFGHVHAFLFTLRDRLETACLAPPTRNSERTPTSTNNLPDAHLATAAQRP
jgi:hypothetical protein